MNSNGYISAWCPLKSRTCDNDCPWWSTERNRCAVLFDYQSECHCSKT